MALDLDALDDRMRRHEADAPRCGCTIDPHLDVTEARENERGRCVCLPRSCSLPRAHEGPCQPEQPMLEWSEHATLRELLAEAREARTLRDRVLELGEQVQRQDDELTDLALRSLYTSHALDAWE